MLKRIHAFDVIEVLAITMACSMHFPLFSEGSLAAQVWMLACSSAVPAFFLVNGALLFTRPFSWGKHLRRIRKIVICLLFWRLVYLVLFSSFGWYDASSLTFEEIVLYFLGVDYPGLPTVHMWFMYALLSMYLLFPLIKLLLENNGRTVVLYSCGVMFFFGIAITDINLIFSTIGRFVPSFDLNITSVSNLYNPFGAWAGRGLFFFLGPILYEFIEKIKGRYSRRSLLLGCGSLFIVGFLYNYVAQYIYTGSVFWIGETLQSEYLHLGTLVMGCTFFSFFCLLPLHDGKFIRVMELLSSNTLTIYYAHMIFMFASTFFIFYPMGLAEGGVMLVVARAVLVVLIGGVLGWTMKKLPLIRIFT